MEKNNIQIFYFTILVTFLLLGCNSDQAINQIQNPESISSPTPVAAVITEILTATSPSPSASSGSNAPTTKTLLHGRCHYRDDYRAVEWNFDFDEHTDGSYNSACQVLNSSQNWSANNTSTSLETLSCSTTNYDWWITSGGTIRYKYKDPNVGIERTYLRDECRIFYTEEPF